MAILEVSSLYFKHERSPSWVLEELSLNLGAGDTCLIVGDNGSGKTTLGKVIGGIRDPQNGRVLINGRSVKSVGLKDRPNEVIYMGQTSYLQFFRSTIADEIRFATRIARQQPNDMSDVYGWFDLPADQTVKPMDLAYPAMWRLQLLLLSMVFNPQVLFIDEIVAPNAGSQMKALKAVLEDRSRKGQATILAYQRPLYLAGARYTQLRDRRLYEL